MRKGRGEAGETVTGGRAATVRHVFGERVLSICMPNGKDHPKGWRWVALSDVAQMESGHTPSRNHPEYWGGEIPWISVKDARLAHGKRLSETEEYTNSLGIANSSARLLPKDTVCLSRGGTVGYVVILDKPMATSQGFANWICGPQLVPEFLQYLLLAEAESLEKFSIGTTIKTIYYPDLKAFHVCLPPLPEQKRIVALLDEAFAGIDEAKAKAEELELAAKDLKVSILGKLIETKEAKTKIGWKSVKLEELIEIQNGYAFSSKDYSDSGHFLMRIGNVQNGYVSPTEPKYVRLPEDGSLDRFSLLKDDILVSLTGNVGRVGVVQTPHLPAALNQRVARVSLRSNNLVTREYLLHFLYSDFFRKKLESSGRGSAQQNVSTKDIIAIEIPLPPLAEQKRIVKLLDEAFAEIFELNIKVKSKFSAFSELKVSLLEQAFAGELTS
jgi:type I restriction enzyme S subunit